LDLGTFSVATISASRQLLPMKAAADISNCPSTPLSARASCFCKQLTTAGYNRYYADIAKNCTGAIFCRSATRSNYTSCRSGKRFNQLKQACDTAANAKCGQIPLCTAGFSSNSTCGQAVGGKCCKISGSSACCSRTGVCTGTAGGCRLDNGCQPLYGLCTQPAPPSVKPPSGPLMVGYYESWSAKFLPGTRKLDISAIPGLLV
jgi:hypothetical protein